MKVTMLQEREAALDGVNFVQLEEGETYDIPEFLADSYVQRGIAEPAGDSAPVAAAEPVADPDAPPAEAEAPNTSDDAAPAEADAAEADPLAELMKLTRPALDEQAEKLGIADAQGLPNKDAVARAILAARG